MAQTQGEVKPLVLATFTHDAQIFSNSLAQQLTFLKIEQRQSRQQKKIMAFISLKVIIKVAQSMYTPILFVVVRPITNEDVPKKNKKSKTNICASVAHGMTKSEKHHMFKEFSPT